MADKKKKDSIKIVKVTFIGSAASDDWMRAGRLRQKAEAGDKEAAKELAEMEGSRMVRNNDI